MNQTRFYLLVEVGPAKGQRHFIPDSGAKLGRSSSNDICIVDAQLSRQHCVFEFRNGHLWVKDQASANFTLVNDAQVREQLLRPGDRVQVGETVLRVVTEDAPTTNASVIPGVSIVAGAQDLPQGGAPALPIINIPAPLEGERPREPGAPGEHALPKIDLGLAKPAQTDAKKNNMVRSVLYLVAAVVVLVLGIVLMNDLLSSKTEDVKTAAEPPDQTLQFEFEKIEVTPDNILRLHLSLTPDGILSGQMSDLAQRLSLPGGPKQLQPADVDRLRLRLNQAEGVARFMALNPVYELRTPIPSHEYETAVTLVVGKEARRSVVRNRPEPPEFRFVREILESFGSLELQLINLSGEQLDERAEASLREAQKLVEEAGLDLGNLWRAVNRYEAAEAYLVSRNPKPLFHADIVSGREVALEQLKTEYDQFRFSADHAMRTSNWPLAQRHLQSIKRLIPDERDERHQKAHRDLLNVEPRMK